MPGTLVPTDDTLREVAHETFLAGLRNAHALEKQAVAVLESQLGRMHDYPDLHARISAHTLESREQSRRLETALDACGASTSMMKDVMMSVMGVGQSSAQGFADDAVIKAVLADSMFEHLEIASYRSLIELAEMAGKSELIPLLEETLHEEEAMATWLEDNLKAITRRYVEISAGQLEASKPPKSAVNAADDTETESASDSADIAVIQEETRARVARARDTSERVAMAAGGVAARKGDPNTRSGDETTTREEGNVGEAQVSNSHFTAGDMTPEYPDSEHVAYAGDDAARGANDDRMVEKAR